MVEDLYVLPASPGQAQMYLIHHMYRGRTPYHIAGGMRIRGPVDLAALRQALAALVERHEILRTHLRLGSSGDIDQVVRSAADIELNLVEGAEHPDRRAYAESWLEEFAKQPFDLDAGPILRTALVRLGEDDHMLAVVIHHVAADGWSMAVLTEDLSELYRAIVEGTDARLPELPLQYADFAVWQRENLDKGLLDEQRAIWRTKLADAKGVELPAGPPQPPTASAAVRPFELDSGELALLHAMGRTENATLFMVLLAGFAASIARWCGQTDLVIATPIAGRGHPDLDRLVGYFVNTLPLRLDLSGDPAFVEILRRVRDTCISAYENQDVPFDMLLADLAKDRGRPRLPIARIMFALDNAPRPEPSGFAGATIERIELPPNTGGFELAANIAESADGLRGHLVGDGRRVQGPALGAAAEDWRAVLAAGCAQGDLPLSKLPGPLLQGGRPVGGAV